MGHNALYRNNHDGTFTDVSEKAGILAPGGRYGDREETVSYRASRRVTRSLTAPEVQRGKACSKACAATSSGTRSAARLPRSNPLLRA